MVRASLTEETLMKKGNGHRKRPVIRPPKPNRSVFPTGGKVL